MIQIPRMYKDYDREHKPKDAIKLKVFMLPTFHEVNQYGPALVESLVQEGVKVKFISPWTRFLPLLDIFRKSGWSRPEIIHLQWIDAYTIKPFLWQSVLASIFFVLELKFLKVVGIKIVWTIHDYYALHGNKFPRIDTWVRSITAKLADAIIIHSKNGKNKVTNLYKLNSRENKKIQTIPMGHYIGRFPNDLSRNEARNILGLDEDLLIYGLIGHICSYKRVPFMIKTFRQINDTRLGLLIAGKPHSPELGQTITAQAAGDHRIHLHLAFIENQKFQTYLNAIDVMVLPFDPSLAASSILLAMSFGKAVVASTNIASVAEVLPPGGGLIFDAKDPHSLLKSLRRIRKMDIVEMGEKNLAQARRFGWDSIAKETIRVYQKAVG